MLIDGGINPAFYEALTGIRTPPGGYAGRPGEQAKSDFTSRE
jgi:hypothetical protein